MASNLKPISSYVLPSLPTDTDDIKGPIDTSHWVIPGRVIAGSYPGSILEEKHTQVIRDIVLAGVTHFVCLLDKEEHDEVIPYETIANDIAAEYGRKLTFEHFHMIDLRGAEDSELLQFIPQLAQLIRTNPNELLYIHCWGGHGRTGIIVALLLVVLYELNAEEALRLTELYHSKRIKTCGCHSPQTTVQFEQVRRLGEIFKDHASLPPLFSDTADVRGPTEFSNWVIPNRLLAGAYPGHVDFTKHKEIINNIMDTGVTCFVCLMLDHELERFVPYQTIAKEKATKLGHSLKFIQFQILDGHTPKDSELLQFIPQLAQLIRTNHNELLYIHCWGGHGRTGIIVALLLIVLYELNAEEALRLTQLYHSKRVDPRGQNSPQTRAQIEQVKRLSQEYRKSFKRNLFEPLEIDVN